MATAAVGLDRHEPQFTRGADREQAHARIIFDHENFMPGLDRHGSLDRHGIGRSRRFGAGQIEFDRGSNPKLGVELQRAYDVPLGDDRAYRRNEISSLCQRMSEDMTIRQFGDKLLHCVTNPKHVGALC